MSKQKDDQARLEPHYIENLSIKNRLAGTPDALVQAIITERDEALRQLKAFQQKIRE